MIRGKHTLRTTVANREMSSSCSSPLSSYLFWLIAQISVHKQWQELEDLNTLFHVLESKENILADCKHTGNYTAKF